jgi:CRP-like cAMP-binding protein
MKQDDEIVAKRAQLETVQSYVCHIRVPLELKKQIEVFFRTRLKDASLSSVQSEQVYELLPTSLQLEVSKHTVRQLVNGCSLLADCSDGFKDRFASVLHERRMEPETPIFHAGDVCNELLVVRSGAIELYDNEEADHESDPGAGHETRGAGSTVGGIAFTFSIRHFKHARTMRGSETVVFALSRESYKALIKTYPQEESLMMDCAMRRYTNVFDDGKKHCSRLRSSVLASLSPCFPYAAAHAVFAILCVALPSRPQVR